MVGIRRPNRGHISVFGHRPGSPASGIPGPALGYTPQEIALFLDFSIYETFQYFGKLYHIDPRKVERRTDELIALLNLPNKNNYIKNLSGGQKRRVSLAVALIHSPPLLILDEPTVGVDPVLRQNIWDYMNLLTSRHELTIIITTQYIEEARSADLVSFMRNGKLLMERNPNELLKQMSLPTLEAVFLHLCRLENGGDGISRSNQDEFNSKSVIVKQKRLSLPPPTTPSKLATFNSPRFAFVDRIFALNWKNITGIRRNLSMLIIQFLMPSFQCLLNFTCLGPDPYDLPIAVYNADQPPILSNMFLDNLSNVTFRISKFDSMEEAIDRVRQGLAWTAVVFRSNYTRAMQLMAADEVTAVRMPTIGLHMDTTNYVIGNTIQKEFWLTFNHTIAAAAELFGVDVNSSQSAVPNPLSIESIVYGVESPKMSEFMAPGWHRVIVVKYFPNLQHSLSLPAGLISMAIFFAAMALTAITLVLERKDGVFERTLVAGVKTFEFIVSQISTQLLVLAVQVLLSIITMFYIIDLQNQGSIVLVYVITLLQGMCGMALGLVVSAFSENESQALALSMASFLPISIISGIFWPVEAMPAFMKPISYFGPQTLALDAMRAVISKGWSVVHVVVLRGLLATSAWFALLVLLASIGFHLISFR